MNANSLLLINTLATWYMVGLIWLIQIVHYKMFDRVGDEAFAKYAVDHARLITPIVGLPMLIEVATAGALLAIAPEGIPRWVLVVGVALISIIWLSTALVQVPCHEKLAEGFDPAVYQRLVSSNWIRTLAWTARGVLMGFCVWRLMVPAN